MSASLEHLDPDAGIKRKPRQLDVFLLADIIDISEDAIICIDSEQDIILFNEGAERMFGWTSGEVLGEPVEILIPERVRGIHRAHVERFRESPERARKMNSRSRITALRKHGEEFPAEIGIAKVRVDDSVVFSAVLRDVTEHVELEQRLERAVHARDNALGMVAHDLRNPLSLVAMLSGGLLRRGDIDEAPAGLSNSLRLIHCAALEMDRLIQDLLDITHVEAGRMTVDQRAVTTVALLDGALATMRPLVENAGIRFVVDVPATLPMVRTDQKRICQALSNLIGNAIRFTPRDGAITVTAIEENAMIKVSVSDTGTGISHEHLPHIFDRFRQGSQSATRSRSGLGLPIVRGIVQAHGGQLGVKSEVGAGSTFFFTLPLATAYRSEDVAVFAPDLALASIAEHTS